MKTSKKCHYFWISQYAIIHFVFIIYDQSPDQFLQECPFTIYKYRGDRVIAAKRYTITFFTNFVAKCYNSGMALT
jgi:hypothetical protein